MHLDLSNLPFWTVKLNFWFWLTVRWANRKIQYIERALVYAVELQSSEREREKHRCRFPVSVKGPCKASCLACYTDLMRPEPSSVTFDTYASRYHTCVFCGGKEWGVFFSGWVCCWVCIKCVFVAHVFGGKRLLERGIVKCSLMCHHQRNVLNLLVWLTQCCVYQRCQFWIGKIKTLPILLCSQITKSRN